MFEVVLVRFTLCASCVHHLPDSMCLQIPFRPSNARFLKIFLNKKIKKSHYLFYIIGGLLRGVPRRLHNSTLYRQLLPSKACTRETEAETRSETSSVGVGIGPADWFIT